MTHFVTLLYLKAFAPYLVLVAAAWWSSKLSDDVNAQIRSAFLAVSAIAAMVFFTGAPSQDELFSRQLAHDRIAVLSLAAMTVGAVWRRTGPDHATQMDLWSVLCVALLGAVTDGFAWATVATLLAFAPARSHDPRAQAKRFVPAALWWVFFASVFYRHQVSELSLLSSYITWQEWGVVMLLVGGWLAWTRARVLDWLAWFLPVARVAALTLPVDVTGSWVLR